MTRADNLKWLKLNIDRVAVANNTPKIPKNIVFRIAKRLGVTDRTAKSYVEAMEIDRRYTNTRYNLVLDLEKAKRRLESFTQHM